jgi:mRNA-degrading endonuclease HigB of HigAB toxin-antitoxin module
MEAEARGSIVGALNEGQKVLIRHVLTHAEYDKENWKK